MGKLLVRVLVAHTAWPNGYLYIHCCWPVKSHCRLRFFEQSVVHSQRRRDSCMRLGTVHCLLAPSLLFWWKQWRVPLCSKDIVCDDRIVPTSWLKEGQGVRLASD